MIPNSRIYGLDAVRGLCAIGVMAYHYAYQLYGVHLAGLGTFTVYLFFTLSGFVLHSVYGQQEISERMLYRFFSARFFRIFPLYAGLCLLLFAYIALTEGANYDLLSKLLLNITFLFGLTNPGETSLIVGGWSIGIEFVFYSLFPLLLLFRQIWFIGAILLGSVAVSHVYIVQSKTVAPDLWWSTITQPVTYFPFFVGGILGSMLFQRLRQRAIPAIIPIGLLLCLAFMPVLVGINTTAIRESLPLWSAVITGSLAITLLAAMSTYGATLTKLAMFLGEISFALYLIHSYVLGAATKLLPLSGLPLLVIAASISIVAAKFIHDYWEKPARLVGKSWST